MKLAWRYIFIYTSPPSIYPADAADQLPRRHAAAIVPPLPIILMMGINGIDICRLICFISDAPRDDVFTCFLISQQGKALLAFRAATAYCLSHDARTRLADRTPARASAAFRRRHSISFTLKYSAHFQLRRTPISAAGLS